LMKQVDDERWFMGMEVEAQQNSAETESRVWTT